MVATAGTMATARVSRRRTIGRSRRWTKPSMTIWPASVPVMVEDWPGGEQRHGEGDGGDGAPRSGSSRRCASWISATSWWPAR